MVRIDKIKIGGGNPVVLIAGPCIIEGREMTLRIAARIQQIARKLRTPFIFKASYKKANRTSGTSFTGLEMEKALSILAEVKREFGVPVLTDIHSAAEASAAGRYASPGAQSRFNRKQTHTSDREGCHVRLSQSGCRYALAEHHAGVRIPRDPGRDAFGPAARERHDHGRPAPIHLPARPGWSGCGDRRTFRRNPPKPCARAFRRGQPVEIGPPRRPAPAGGGSRPDSQGEVCGLKTGRRPTY